MRRGNCPSRFHDESMNSNVPGFALEIAVGDKVLARRVDRDDLCNQVLWDVLVVRVQLFAVLGGNSPHSHMRGCCSARQFAGLGSPPR